MAKIVVTFALVLAACGTGVEDKALPAKTPQELAEGFATSLNEYDWGAIYDTLSSYTRRMMDRQLLVDVDGKRGIAPSRRWQSIKPTPLSDWSGTDRWIYAFDVAVEGGARIPGEGPYRVAQVKHDGGDVDGAWAYAAIQTGPSGRLETICMVREGQHWRLIFFGPGHGGGITRDDDRWWFPR